MKLEALSMFVPAYNEGKNLANLIPSALRLLSDLAHAYELIIVYDQRSRDNSLELIREWTSSDRALKMVAQSEEDLGYGRALAIGFQRASYPLIFYTDADGQYYLSDLMEMIPRLGEADLIIGYRRRRRDHLLRLPVAYLYNRLARVWFKLNLRDIDCSFKLVKKSVVEGMNLICRTGAVEIELLLRARRKGCRVIEIPVRHRKRVDGASSFEAGPGRIIGLPRLDNVRSVWREMLLLKNIFTP
jgi:glycosyltransferase involved in cell wall biosynthesis